MLFAGEIINLYGVLAQIGPAIFCSHPIIRALLKTWRRLGVGIQQCDSVRAQPVRWDDVRAGVGDRIEAKASSAVSYRAGIRGLWILYQHWNFIAAVSLRVMKGLLGFSNSLRSPRRMARLGTVAVRVCSSRRVTHSCATKKKNLLRFELNFPGMKIGPPTS